MNNFEKSLVESLNNSVQKEEPSKELEQKIFSAVKHGNGRLHMRKFKAAAAFAAIACFVASVNVFPVFAEYLENIPLVAGLVEMVRFDKGMQEIMQKDKGIQDAIESGYGINAKASATDNDMLFTIENVVSDQKRMLLTYSLKYDSDKYGKLESLWFNNMKVTGQGKTLVEMKEGFITDYHINNAFVSRNIIGPCEIGRSGVAVVQTGKDEKDRLYGWMEIVKKDGEAAFPSDIEVAVDGWRSNFMEDAKLYNGSWKVSFTIPKEFVDAEPKAYAGKEFNIKEGKYDLDLKLEYAKLYPTMTALKLQVLDYKNSPTSFFYNMWLEDENGHVYEHLEDGILTDMGNVLPEFASCYFAQPKELYLVIDNLVDTATGKSTPVNIRLRVF